jgi:U3 small nucleolar RNA-associated protein 14
MIKIDTMEQYKVLEYIRTFYIMQLIRVENYDDSDLKVIDEDGQEVIFHWTGREVVIE